MNPEHLFLGTDADNVRDKIAKGRQPRGAAHGIAKLTEADVPVIRALLTNGMSDRAVARRFGVTHETIRALRLGRTWSHVA